MKPDDIKREIQLSYSRGYVRGAESGKKEGERHGYRAGLMDAYEHMCHQASDNWDKARKRKP
jgi:flagellar biosynthesis/type III secretory pathway protein FliH